MVPVLTAHVTFLFHRFISPSLARDRYAPMAGGAECRLAGTQRWRCGLLVTRTDPPRRSLYMADEFVGLMKHYERETSRSIFAEVCINRSVASSPPTKLDGPGHVDERRSSPVVLDFPPNIVTGFLPRQDAAWFRDVPSLRYTRLRRVASGTVRVATMCWVLPEADDAWRRKNSNGSRADDLGAVERWDFDSGPIPLGIDEAKCAQAVLPWDSSPRRKSSEGTRHLPEPLLELTEAGLETRCSALRSP